MQEFVDLAQRVIGELGDPFKHWLENVVVDVQIEPTREMLEDVGLDPDEETLLGLFTGLAVTEQEYGEHAANQILLFKRPIEEVCRSRAEVAYEIRRTLIHELAHHFGYSEEDLAEYEARQSPFDHDEGEPG
ncbi:MAG TPA: metallopeptidase family protein [Pirellulales bacterium]|jgi:predicted Zn-dependent protease with MMP-like domain